MFLRPCLFHDELLTYIAMTNSYGSKALNKVTIKEAVDRLQRFCVYRDRCHSEVRSKLLKLEVYGDDLEEVMSELIRTDFLNEERFSVNYARGKYRTNNWGRIKIKQELKKRKIGEYCIRKALKEIDQEGDYEDRLFNVLMKYVSLRKEKYDEYTLKKMAYLHGLRKGYEGSIVNSALKNIFDKQTSI